MSLLNEEVAKRLANATNTNKQSKTTTPTKKATENGEMSCSSSTTQDKRTDFKVGDFVRSTFEDGVDYEARIMKIDLKSGDAHIKYVGYNNEETVNLSMLLPTWGKKQRKLQKLAAQADKKAKAPKAPPIKIPSNLAYGNKSDPKLLIPPPPPMGPMMEDDDEDAEYLSAMLMSWYMSGYYTGLYQGRKEAAKHQN